MSRYYSAKTGGFYSECNASDFENSKNGWPDDAIAVSDEEYHALFKGQANGKVITANDKGKPILSTPPGPTKEQAVVLAESTRTTLIAEAIKKTQLWQTQLMLGMINDENKKSLIAWMEYVEEVQAVDINHVSKNGWPIAPEI